MRRYGLRRRRRIWHIDATIRGRRIRESLGTEDKVEAMAMLRQRVAELERHGPVALRAPKLTFDDLAQELIRDYELNGKRSIGKAKKSVERLREFFGGWRAVNISTADIRNYIDKRQRAGFS